MVAGLTCECGRQFLNKQGLGGHRRNCEQSSSFNQSSRSETMNSNNNQSVSVSMRPSLSLNSSPTKSQKAKFTPTVCCGIPINSRSGMSNHVRSKKHIAESQPMASQPLQCLVCNEEFVEEACLTVHKSTCR